MAGILEQVKKQKKKGQVLFFPESRNIYICGWIDNKIAAEVNKYLLYCKKSNDDVYLNISSKGGEFGSTFQIIDAIGSMPGKVNTIALGKCWDFSVYLLMSGTGNISANRNCVFAFIHDRIIFTSKHDELYKKKIKLLLKTKNCKIPEFDTKAFYFSADEALKFGIIKDFFPHKKSNSLR
jgi:ATP-dependent protease ClpP protease subunit